MGIEDGDGVVIEFRFREPSNTTETKHLAQHHRSQNTFARLDVASRAKRKSIVRWSRRYHTIRSTELTWIVWRNKTAVGTWLLPTNDSDGNAGCNFSRVADQVSDGGRELGV